MNGAPVVAKVVRQAAALDERTRLRMLFLAAEEKADFTLGEFVAVEIRGDTAQGAYRVPVASLTSRDQVWVVEDGSLRQRAVEVIGGDNTVAVVREFDTADGVVAIPPANSRDGLPVVIQSESRVAGGVSVSVGAK